MQGLIHHLDLQVLELAFFTSHTPSLFHFWFYGVCAEPANSLQAQGVLMKAFHCLGIHSAVSPQLLWRDKDCVLLLQSWWQAGLGEPQICSFYKAVSGFYSWHWKRKSEECFSRVCEIIWMISQTESGRKECGGGHVVFWVSRQNDYCQNSKIASLALIWHHLSKILSDNSAWIDKNPHISSSFRGTQIRITVCKSSQQGENEMGKSIKQK